MGYEFASSRAGGSRTADALAELARRARAGRKQIWLLNLELGDDGPLSILPLRQIASRSYFCRCVLWRSASAAGPGVVRMARHVLHRRQPGPR